MPATRAASGTAGRPTATSSRSAQGASRAPPAVDRDLDELVDAGLELLGARPLEARAQDRDDLAPRAAVDEDDEAEAEARLVERFSSASSASTSGSSSVPCSAAERADRPARAPIAGCASSTAFCSSARAPRDVARLAERIVERASRSTSAVSALEQLGQLLDGQLPR
jgi:hypothetical protein